MIAQAQQSFELALQRLHAALTRNAERDRLRDGAHLGRHIGQKPDFSSPRTLGFPGFWLNPPEDGGNLIGTELLDQFMDVLVDHLQART